MVQPKLAIDRPPAAHRRTGTAAPHPGSPQRNRRTSSEAPIIFGLPAPRLRAGNLLRSFHPIHGLPHSPPGRLSTSLYPSGHFGQGLPGAGQGRGIGQASHAIWCCGQGAGRCLVQAGHRGTGAGGHDDRGEQTQGTSSRQEGCSGQVPHPGGGQGGGHGGQGGAFCSGHGMATAFGLVRTGFEDAGADGCAQLQFSRAIKATTRRPFICTAMSVPFGCLFTPNIRRAGSATSADLGPGHGLDAGVCPDLYSGPCSLQARR